MALDVADCERMIAAAQQNGVRLGVDLHRHHYPVVARLRDLITSAELGQPVHAVAEAFERFDPPSNHPRAWLLRKRSQAEADGRLRLSSNRGAARSARTDRARPWVHGERALQDRDVEDTCTAHLDFRSGAQAVVTVTHAASERRDRLSIFGTEGSAHVDELNSGLLRIVSPHGVDEASHPPHPNLHRPLVEDFLAAIRENREPAVTGQIGLEVTRVVAAIYGTRRLPSATSSAHLKS